MHSAIVFAAVPSTALRIRVVHYVQQSVAFPTRGAFGALRSCLRATKLGSPLNSHRNNAGGHPGVICPAQENEQSACIAHAISR